MKPVYSFRYLLILIYSLLMAFSFTYFFLHDDVRYGFDSEWVTLFFLFFIYFGWTSVKFKIFDAGPYFVFSKMVGAVSATIFVIVAINLSLKFAIMNPSDFSGFSREAIRIVRYFPLVFLSTLILDLPVAIKRKDILLLPTDLFYFFVPFVIGMMFYGLIVLKSIIFWG